MYTYPTLLLRSLFFVCIGPSLCCSMHEYGLMSYEEYSSIGRSELYKFRITYKDQHLFYFGANHSVDPNNEQFSLLMHFWQEFIEKTGGINCVVLVEGNIGPIHTSYEEALTNGEGSFITYLAAIASIPIECPEPSRNIRIHQLLQEFSPEEVLYMFAAQGALQGHRALPYRRHFSLEAYVENYLDMLREQIKLPLSLQTIKDIHTSLFNEPFDLYDKDFFYRITNPAIKDTRINLICRRNSIFRDTHIVSYLETLLRTGKNLFVVFGSTHAIMQEKALRMLVI